ncbi:MAG: hypothetical protein KIT09_00205 [Bryobacteraceae bacterium]|nr:hypothetical protein [Bryobacteraceae bacterium]
MNPKLLLGGVIALFVGLLIATYLVARSANPVMLDEKGRVVEAGHRR